MILGVIQDTKLRAMSRVIRGRMATCPKGHMRRDLTLPMTCFSQYPLGEAAIPKSIEVWKWRNI